MLGIMSAGQGHG